MSARRNGGNLDQKHDASAMIYSSEATSPSDDLYAENDIRIGGGGGGSGEGGGAVNIRDDRNDKRKRRSDGTVSGCVKTNWYELTVIILLLPMALLGIGAFILILDIRLVMPTMTSVANNANTVLTQAAIDTPTLFGSARYISQSVNASIDPWTTSINHVFQTTDALTPQQIAQLQANIAQLVIRVLNLNISHYDMRATQIADAVESLTEGILEQGIIQIQIPLPSKKN